MKGRLYLNILLHNDVIINFNSNKIGKKIISSRFKSFEFNALRATACLYIIRLL